MSWKLRFFKESWTLNYCLQTVSHIRNVSVRVLQNDAWSTCDTWIDRRVTKQVILVFVLSKSSITRRSLICSWFLLTSVFVLLKAHAPVIKYDKGVCGRLTAYCMVQYVLTVVFYDSLVAHKQVISAFFHVIHIRLFTLALLSGGHRYGIFIYSWVPEWLKLINTANGQ